jgi:hypothetical protein
MARRSRRLLAAALAAAGASAAQFDMHGECAAVVTLQKWQEAPATGGGPPVSRWDMRIKVHPWTIFGKVHVTLRGNDLSTDNVFGGDAVLGGADVTVFRARHSPEATTAAWGRSFMPTIPFPDRHPPRDHSLMPSFPR